MKTGTSAESATRVAILLTLAAVNAVVSVALLEYGSQYQDFLAANMEGKTLPDTVRLSLVCTRKHYILYLAFASLSAAYLVARLHFRTLVSRRLRDAAITLIVAATLGIVGITITGILRAGVELHIEPALSSISSKKRRSVEQALPPYGEPASRQLRTHLPRHGFPYGSPPVKRDVGLQRRE
jgi:hypothetical protein